MLPLPIVKGFPAYNVDPTFNVSGGPFHYFSNTWYFGPWGVNDWGVSAYQWNTCCGSAPVDEYIFSASPGNAYAWLYAINKAVVPCFTVGVVRYVQGLNEGGGSWYDPGPISVTPWTLQSISLTYALTRQNSAFPNTLVIAESGILFDLKVNSTNLKKPVLIDLYLNQDCQNDPACLSKQVGYLNCDEPTDVHVQRWRIHADFSDNQWISDTYDLSTIIQTSVGRAYNQEAGGNCANGADNVVSGTTSLIQLQVVAEAFNAKEGIDISYVSLQPPTPPSPPQFLKLMSSTTTSVTVSWSPPGFIGSPPTSSYKIYRGTYPGQESYYTIVDSSTTSLTDSPLSSGTIYYYYVTAISSAGYESTMSNELAVYVPTSSSPSPCTASASPTLGRLSVTVTFSVSCPAGVSSATWYFHDYMDPSATGYGQTTSHTYGYDLSGQGTEHYYPTVTVVDGSSPPVSSNPSVPTITVYCTGVCPTRPSP